MQDRESSMLFRVGIFLVYIFSILVCKKKSRVPHTWFLFTLPQPYLIIKIINNNNNA